MDNGTLNWSLPSALAELGRLPVRLLAEDGRVVSEGLSGRDIQVAPGRYLLACTLPNGREIVRRKPIEIAAGEKVDPVFPFLEFDLLVEDAAERGRTAAVAAAGGVLGFVRRLAALLRGEASPGGAGAASGMRLVRGDWMGRASVVDAPGSGDFETADSVATRPASAAGAPQLISRPLDSPDDTLIEAEAAGVRRFWVVPFDWLIGSSSDPAIQVEMRPGENGPTPHFTSPLSAEANGFVAFVTNGLLDQSRALGSDLLDRSQDALHGDGVSALQAVLAAYVLLRANALEEIEPRVARLAELLDWIPDVRVIEAEALSRIGKHAQAVAALRRAVTGGCPWFRSGVSYALERLRLYVDVDAEDSASFNLSDEDRRLFKERRDYFEAMGRRLDTSSLFTAFAYPNVDQKREQRTEAALQPAAVAD